MVAINVDVAGAGEVLDERVESRLPSSPVCSVEITSDSSGLIDFPATLSAALLCDRLSTMDA